MIFHFAAGYAGVAAGAGAGVAAGAGAAALVSLLLPPAAPFAFLASVLTFSASSLASLASFLAFSASALAFSPSSLALATSSSAFYLSSFDFWSSSSLSALASESFLSSFGFGGIKNSSNSCFCLASAYSTAFIASFLDSKSSSAAFKAVRLSFLSRGAFAFSNAFLAALALLSDLVNSSFAVLTFFSESWICS